MDTLTEEQAERLPDWVSTWMSPFDAACIWYMKELDLEGAAQFNIECTEGMDGIGPETAAREDNKDVTMDPSTIRKHSADLVHSWVHDYEMYIPQEDAVIPDILEAIDSALRNNPNTMTVRDFEFDVNVSDEGDTEEGLGVKLTTDFCPACGEGTVMNVALVYAGQFVQEHQLHEGKQRLRIDDGPWFQKVLRLTCGNCGTHIHREPDDGVPEYLRMLMTGDTIVDGKFKLKSVDELEAEYTLEFVDGDLRASVHFDQVSLAGRDTIDLLRDGGMVDHIQGLQEEAPIIYEILRGMGTEN